jgi:hypothetical protein
MKKLFKNFWDYLTLLNGEMINAQIFIGRGKF